MLFEFQLQACWCATTAATARCCRSLTASSMATPSWPPPTSARCCPPAGTPSQPPPPTEGTRRRTRTGSPHKPQPGSPTAWHMPVERVRLPWTLPRVSVERTLVLGKEAVSQQLYPIYQHKEQTRFLCPILDTKSLLECVINYYTWAPVCSNKRKRYLPHACLVKKQLLNKFWIC